MLHRFINFINHHHLAHQGSPILLAVSGGADSVAMLDMFAKAGFKFAIAHVNFHLRGDESNRDEQFVRSLAEKYGAEIFVKSFDTERYATDNHLSIEMAARDLRYAEFEQIMNKNGYAVTAVAHHIDDSIETFVLNALRGSGINGLTGIRVSNGRIIRPMLCFSRKEIEKYVEDNKLEYVTDRTNLETDFSRNKIRNCVAPYFEQINPSYRNSFAQTFSYLQQVKEIYFQEIENQRKRLTRTEGNDTHISIPELMQHPQKEAVLFELLRPFGFNKTQSAQILSAADAESGKSFISHGYRLIKDRNSFIISPIDDKTTETETLIGNDIINKGVYSGNGCELRFDFISPSDFHPGRDQSTAYFDFDSLQMPLTLRHWHEGDTIVPFGRQKPKKLSDIFVDMKLTRAHKERVPILCSGGNIIWAVGVRASDCCKVSTETKRILRITKVL